MWRGDQDWIHRDSMPPALRVPGRAWRLRPLPEQVDALVRMVRLLQQRGIEVRLVIAPYAQVRPPSNVAQYAALLERRTGLRVWNYAAAIDDLDGFADRVHLNERGSRALIAMLVRDGAFGMARRAARF